MFNKEDRDRGDGVMLVVDVVALEDDESERVRESGEGGCTRD